MQGRIIFFCPVPMVLERLEIARYTPSEPRAPPEIPTSRNNQRCRALLTARRPLRSAIMPPRTHQNSRSPCASGICWTSTSSTFHTLAPNSVPCSRSRRTSLGQTSCSFSLLPCGPKTCVPSWAAWARARFSTATPWSGWAGTLFSRAGSYGRSCLHWPTWIPLLEPTAWPLTPSAPATSRRDGRATWTSTSAEQPRRLGRQRERGKRSCSTLSVEYRRRGNLFLYRRVIGTRYFCARTGLVCACGLYAYVVHIRATYDATRWGSCEYSVRKAIGFDSVVGMWSVQNYCRFHPRH